MCSTRHAVALAGFLLCASTVMTRDAQLVRALGAGVIAVYVALTLAGQSLFVTKTLVVPLIVVYGCLARDRVGFLRDWLPFITAVVLFDALRGAIFVLIQHDLRPVFQDYVIATERVLTGTPALAVPLQAHWRTPLLDRAFVALHGSHFLLFLLFGLALWHQRREAFAGYRTAMIAVMYTGLILYFAVPTVPPWLAARTGAIPDIVPITHEVYTMRVPAAFITALDTNPVAAMPSLHAAFPAVCAIFAWSAFGRLAGVALAAYAGAMGLGLMYLGEHYLLDVLGGFALAGAACYALRTSRATAQVTLPRAVAHGALKVALTLAIGLATAALRL
jgi:membrane-associated phospholipid phosphatase